MHLSSIIATALALLAVAAPPVSAQCARSCVRKDIRYVTLAERTAYFAALRKLKDNGTYNRYVTTHLNANAYAHGTPQFLPWHRAFMHAFENDLQAVDATVCAHYWAWETDAQSPERSIIFTDPFYGGNGNPANGNCISNGQFADWKTHDGRCITRIFSGPSSTIGAFSGPALLTSIKSASASFEAFANNLEGAPHANVHNGIAGEMSGMGSPDDPIFMLHHSNVDRIWHNFQVTRPELNNVFTSMDNKAHRRVNMNDIVVPWTFTVQSVFNIAPLCYSYAEVSTADINPVLPPAANSPTPATPIVGGTSRAAGFGEDTPATPAPAPAPVKPTITIPLPGDGNVTYGPIPDASASPPYDPYDRSDLSHIRHSPPIPDQWIIMNNLSIPTIRAYEAQHRSIIDKINNISGYTEPSCLYNRYDLWAGIIANTKTFYVDIPNRGRITFSDVSGEAYRIISEIQNKLVGYFPELQLPYESYQDELTKTIGTSLFPKDSASNPHSVIAAASVGAPAGVVPTGDATRPFVGVTILGAVLLLHLLL